eukprot:351518-Chlamydomonas_euryale.AAC.6
MQRHQLLLVRVEVWECDRVWTTMRFDTRMPSDNQPSHLNGASPPWSPPHSTTHQQQSTPPPHSTTHQQQPTPPPPRKLTSSAAF